MFVNASFNMNLFKKKLSTKDKPKIIFINNGWRCYFKNIWYGGESVLDCYNNCLRFHYPKEL